MTLWTAIRPESSGTKILVTSGPYETLLKARLAPRTAHPRALPTLLEALALWEGQAVRGVLCAGARDDSSDTNLFRDSFPFVEPTPLFRLDVAVEDLHEHRDGLTGLGDFRRLRRVLLEEAAR